MLLFVQGRDATQLCAQDFGYQPTASRCAEHLRVYLATCAERDYSAFEPLELGTAAVLMCINVKVARRR